MSPLLTGAVVGVALIALWLGVTNLFDAYFNPIKTQLDSIGEEIKKLRQEVRERLP